MPLDPTRATRITASMAPALMKGDPAVLQRLFLRAIGDPRYEPDDFEHSWLARYGLAIEPLALDWHAEKTGEPLIDRGTQLFHPLRDYVSCTLDARRASTNTVVDVKAINSFMHLDDVVAYYAPQLLVQQECARADGAALLVVHGGNEPQELEVYLDDFAYRAAVWDRIEKFWECVETLTPPVPLVFPRIVPPEKWRRIDLDHDADLPNWADEMRALLTQWAETEPAAKLFEASKVEIKKLLPDDCGRLVHAQFTIARSKNNAVTIRQRSDK